MIPMIGRRQFLVQCSIVGVAAASAPAAILGSSERELPLDAISYGAFRSRLQTTFLVHVPEASPVRLRLIEAKVLPSMAPTGSVLTHEAFSLLFSGPSDHRLEQQTYQFSHETLPRWPMFIVPMRRSGGEGCYYQAIFSRSRAAATARPEKPQAQLT